MGRLEELGIDEAAPGVCEDTFENRRRMRDAGLRWVLVPGDETGTVSGLVEVVDEEYLDAQNRGAFEARRDVLADPRDPWSDYLDVRELPIEAPGVPYWIWRLRERWFEWDRKCREAGGPRRGEPHLPTRCLVVKADGARCWSWAADAAADGKCRVHAPGKALAANWGYQTTAARVKMAQALPAMVDQLEALALNAESEPVRLKAVTEMLDRAGVRAGVEVDLTGTLTHEGPDPSQEIRGRLAALGERIAAAELLARGQADPADVVDAETVEEAP